MPNDFICIFIALKTNSKDTQTKIKSAMAFLFPSTKNQRGNETGGAEDVSTAFDSPSPAVIWTGWLTHPPSDTLISANFQLRRKDTVQRNGGKTLYPQSKVDRQNKSATLLLLLFTPQPVTLTRPGDGNRRTSPWQLHQPAQNSPPLPACR